MIDSASRSAFANRIDQLEEVATNLFFQKGYHATSMRDIARAAGIQPASIYHHFSSKQALLVAVLGRTMDGMIERAEEAISQHSEPRDQLREMVRRHVLLQGLHREEGFVGDIELRGLSRESRPSILNKRDRYQRLFEDVLASGEQKGDFLVDDRKLTVYAILALCNQVAMWYRVAGRVSLEQIANYYADVALLVVRERQAMNAELDGSRRALAAILSLEK